MRKNYPHTECPKCHQMIANCGFKKHISVCTGKKKEPLLIFEDIKINESTKKYICPHCQKEYSKHGIATHIWINHTKEGAEFNKNRPKGKNHNSWNRGKTKETDERIKKMSNTLQKKYKNGQLHGSFKGKHHSEETKQKIREKRIEYLSKKRHTV